MTQSFCRFPMPATLRGILSQGPSAAPVTLPVCRYVDLTGATRLYLNPPFVYRALAIKTGCSGLRTADVLGVAVSHE